MDVEGLSLIVHCMALDMQIHTAHPSSVSGHPVDVSTSFLTRLIQLRDLMLGLAICRLRHIVDAQPWLLRQMPFLRCI